MFVALSPQAYGQRARISIGDPEGWTFWADRIIGDRGAGTIEALGNVVIEKGSDRIQADQARYTEENRTVEIQGNVIFTSSEFKIEAEKFILNLDTKNGKIISGSIFFIRKIIMCRGRKSKKPVPKLLH